MVVLLKEEETNPILNNSSRNPANPWSAARTKPTAQNASTEKNAAVRSQKAKTRSVEEWMTWLQSQGGWKLTRDGVARFGGDREAFEQIGLSHGEYDEIFGWINTAILDVWGGSPDRIFTGGDTAICIYEGDPGLNYIYGRFMLNLERSLEAVVEKKKLEGITVTSVDKNLLEAIIRICRKEPVLRNFGLAKLETSFQDMVQDGKSTFRVVEKLYDAEGNIMIQTEYMSPRIPEPYNAELWIEWEK